MVTNYQEAKIQNREALRRGLLDAASRILVNNGLEALNMRAVAKEVQASTKVLYTLFGNKEGLLEQLYREGFERLRAVLKGQMEDAPVTRLKLLGRAYRNFALENPNYYAILVSLPTSHFTPSAQSIQEAEDSFEVIASCVQECVNDHIMMGEVELIAITIWACMHGVISLELSGHLAKYSSEWREQLFDSTVQNVIRGFFTKEF